MITFTNFLEIFTTLILCVACCMVFAILAQIIHAKWYKQKYQKLKALYLQKRQEAEQQKKERLLNQLASNYNIVRVEKGHLLTENEALRRELKLYSEIRSDMISYAMRLEEKNFNLVAELNATYQEIDSWKKEQSNQSIDMFEQLVSGENNNLKDDDDFVELDIATDAIIQAKGISIEEMTELPRIMQGASDISDIDAVVIVAKTDGTVLSEQLQQQIKDSKQHIGSLIERIDQRMKGSDSSQEATETYFYENTGFSIRDFLPSKSA